MATARSQARSHLTPGYGVNERNKVQRGPGWNNKPVVIVVDAGREFAFTRTELGGGTMLWRYQFEPEGEGTRVTESYELVRPMSRAMWFVIERICGRNDRRSDLRQGLQQTLEQVRAVAEAPQARVRPGNAPGKISC